MSTAGFVTPAGTTWRSRSTPLGEHGNARWLVADEQVAVPGRPTVLYVHGLGHDEDHFEQAPLWKPLRERLMDEGWVVVEGLGGATSDGTAARNWGRPAARTAYSAYLQEVAGRLDLGPVVVLGRSMGGIAASNLYLHDPFVSSLARGLMLHQTACSLLALADVPSGQGKFWPQLFQAWGMPDRETFLAYSESADPVRFAPEVWRDKNVWVAVATADPLVPPDDHGLALRRGWAGLPDLDRVHVRRGGVHADPEIFAAVDEMMSFLYAVTRTVAPPAATGFRVVRRGRWTGSGLQDTVSRRRYEG